jgi:F0F1-type ATP synthase assembly protein I
VSKVKYNGNNKYPYRSQERKAVITFFVLSIPIILMTIIIGFIMLEVLHTHPLFFLFVLIGILLIVWYIAYIWHKYR